MLSNLEEEGYYSPRDRYLDKNELRSVLKNLAKFHADGIKFLRETKLEFPFLKVKIGLSTVEIVYRSFSPIKVNSDKTRYSALQAEETRKVATRRLIDRFLQPYLQFLEQFTPVQPAVLLLKQMARNGTIHDMVFNEMENCEAKFCTVCHK